MLEIKGISVSIKGKKKKIIENLDLEIDKDGINIPNNISNVTKLKLAKVINNKDKYEISIKDAIFNQKSIKSVDFNSQKEKQEFLDNLKELDNSNTKINNNFMDYAMKKLETDSNTFSEFLNKIDKKLRNDKFIEDCNNGVISMNSLEKNKKIVSNQNTETTLVIDNDNSNFDVNDLKISCQKLNESGFTLVELLATMAILAIIMLMAIPNVIGVVQRNKNKTYVEDAKKLVSLAEYKVRSNSNYKPINGANKCIYLSDLSVSDLSEAPNGGTYSTSKSYVSVSNSNGTLKYEVQLQETKENSVIGGIAARPSTDLYNSDLATLVKAPATWGSCQSVGVAVSGTGSDEYGDKVTSGSSSGGSSGTSTNGGSVITTPSTGSGTSTNGGSVVTTPSTGSGTGTCSGGSIVSPPATTTPSTGTTSGTQTCG